MQKAADQCAGNSPIYVWCLSIQDHLSLDDTNYSSHSLYIASTYPQSSLSPRIVSKFMLYLHISLLNFLSLSSTWERTDGHSNTLFLPFFFSSLCIIHLTMSLFLQACYSDPLAYDSHDHTNGWSLTNNVPPSGDQCKRILCEDLDKANSGLVEEVEGPGPWK